ncbi:MAG: hypothetical protein P4K94_02320 [Terracidiphilus sp.]|nr:hypothetical protein [Terracidiphilus sp.]
MNDSEDFGLNDQGRLAQIVGESHPRAVGSPLPVGAGVRSSRTPALDDRKPVSSVPPPGRALASSSTTASEAEQPSSIQRAVSALRLALPFVQRILPLLDGNIASTVSNILSPHPQTPQHSAVNLAHIEDGLTDLQTQHRDLREQMVEQNSSLKRVEDQLEMVREATDRNTLEQQELIEDLKGVGNKVNLLALTALCLLAISIIVNVVLYLHIQRVLP